MNNFHTHTYRCWHANGSDQQFVEAAIDAGVKVLGFSDHAPVPNCFKTEDRMTNEESYEYIDSINFLKEKYKDKIEILVGFECEWLFDRIDHLKDLKERSDYLILGQHERYLIGDRYDYTFYANDDALRRYRDEVIEAIKSGLFSYLCHPEYVLLGRRTFNSTCEEIFNDICKTAKEYDLPLEINLKGFENKGNFDGKIQPYYPLRKFWEIASKYKNKAIFGFDAHRPKDMYRGMLISEVLKLLEGLDIEIIDTIK